MMRQRTNPVDADLDRKLLEGDEDWIQKQGNLNMDMVRILYGISLRVGEDGCNDQLTMPHDTNADRVR